MTAGGGPDPFADAPGAERFALVRGALRRPVTVFMCCIAAIVVGLVGLRVIPLQLLPDGFEANGMTLIFPYPNADPLSVERDIVRPVEEALGTVPELREVEAEAASNRARISLEFGGRTDMDLAALEVRDRLERIRAELPREAQRFLVWRHAASNFPDMAFGVLIPEHLGLAGFQVIERRLIPRLARVDGVAAVDTWGGLIDREVHVELAEDRVRAHKVDLRDLVDRLATENFSLPAGALEDGGRRLLVRAAGPFDSLEDLERYPVDRTLVLGDIGEATLALGYRDNVSRMDGKDIVWVVVRRESGRNAVEVCRAVREAVVTLADDPALDGFTVAPMWDAGESIEAALDELEGSILWGALLAIAVLVVFLRDLRATLVIAAAIPFSVVVTIAVMVLWGFTLNVLTLAGLTLAVGMLVDNAIVVVENVLRLRERGEAPLEAAARGSGEVALAVTLATLTSVVVFLPLVFVSDEPRVRVMISNLAGPISFSLAASLVTALLVVPLLAARIRAKSAAGPGGKPARGPLHWVRERVVAVVGLTLRRRVESFVAMTAVLVLGGWWLGQHVERRADEGGPVERIQVRVRLDSATTLAEANRVFETYERFLLPRKADYGAKHVQARFDRRGGSLELRLLPGGEREEDLESIRKRLKADLPELPGVRLVFRGGGDEEGDQERGGRVSVSLTGPDSEVLLDLAEALRERLRGTPGVEGIEEDDDSEGAREVRIELDREAVARAGTSPNALLGTLAYQLRGSRLRDLRIDGEDIPLIVQFATPDGGESVGWLRAVPVMTPRGSATLEALAAVTTGRGPREIERVDRKTRVEVTALSSAEEAWRLDRTVREVMATFPLPEGTGYEIGGAFEGFEEQLAEIMKVLALGIGFMFLLMGVLFESFVLPVAVLPSLPFAFVGAYLGLWATGTPQDVIATLGSVVLAGIVVNNAIVLVDAINRGVESGLEQTVAITAAVRDRFRPVLLTTATTVVGLLPMAWQPATEGVLSYHSLARAVLAGLTASTIGTLIAVPLCWALLDDLRRMGARVAARYWR